MKTSKLCGGHLADFDAYRLIRFLLLKKHIPPMDFFFSMTRLVGARIQTLRPLENCI